MSVILFMRGIQLIALGALGEYIGRMFNETKGRPLYFTKAFIPSRHAMRSAQARRVDLEHGAGIGNG